MTDTAHAKVDLDQPITRGDTKIASIDLRTPKSGELRGLNMIDLVQLKVDAIHELLPRITNPPLTREEVENLHPADMFALSTEIADFFLPKAARGSLDE